MKNLNQLWPDSYYIDPVYLGLCRILYCSIVLMFIGLPSYTWISRAPDYLFAPPTLSLANLFGGFPGRAFFQTLSIVNLCSFFCMFLGIRTRFSSIVFTITAIIGHNFWYSFGKIDHLLLWILTPFFMAMAGWGNFFSMDSLSYNKPPATNEISNSYNSFWVTAFAVTIAFSMFTSGIQKVAGGWLSLDAEAVRFHLIRKYFMDPRTDSVINFILKIENSLFWKSMDYFALIMEVGFLFSVLRVRAFRLFVAVAVVFHILVLLMYNIPFYSNLIAYIVFIDWEGLFGRFRSGLINSWEHRSGKLIGYLFAISLCFFPYWIAHQFLRPYDLRSPGLIETLVTLFNLPDGYNFSINMFFSCTFVFLICIVGGFVARHSIKPTQA